MDYTESDFLSIINSNIDRIKEEYPEAKVLSGSFDAESVAIALKSEIIDTFLRMTHHGNNDRGRAYFDSVSITELKVLENGDRQISIKFPPSSIKRPSLVGFSSSKKWADANGGYERSTGKGVYDIFGLFTNGVSSSNKVYGYWVYGNIKNSDTYEETYWVKGRQNRAANHFITDICSRYERNYPGLKIILPKLWASSSDNLS